MGTGSGHPMKIIYNQCADVGKAFTVNHVAAKLNDWVVMLEMAHGGVVARMRVK